MEGPGPYVEVLNNEAISNNLTLGENTNMMNENSYSDMYDVALSQIIFKDVKFHEWLNHLMLKAETGMSPSQSDITLINSYLIGILTRNHFKSNDFVLNLTTSVFFDPQICEAENMFVLQISNFRTLNEQFLDQKNENFYKSPICCICLSEEEYYLFERYYRYIRPKTTENFDDEPFFISFNGKPIGQPEQMVQRFTSKKGFEKITTRRARQALSCVLGYFVDEETKNEVLCYMNSFQITNRNDLYRVILARKSLINILESTQLHIENDEVEFEGGDDDKMRTLLMLRPITDAYVPYVTRPFVREVLDIEKNHDLVIKYVERYNYKVSLLVMQHIAKLFKTKPNDRMIEVKLEEENMFLKKKYYARVRSLYEPGPKRSNYKNNLTIQSISSDKGAILEKIQKQEWDGLYMKHNLPNRGRGLFALKKFSVGQIICDYFGSYLENKLGHDKYQATGGCYMLKFRYNSKDQWRDATESPDAIPSFGRILNHSSKHPNAEPKIVDLEKNGQPHVLFLAVKCIKEGDEIFWNYDPQKLEGLTFDQDCYCTECAGKKAKYSRFEWPGS